MLLKSPFLTAAYVLATTLVAAPAMAEGEKMEKCYGIVKMGVNDCANAAGTHSCASLAKKDGDPGEWLLLPAGTCEKILHGSLEPK